MFLHTMHLVTWPPAGWCALRSLQQVRFYASGNPLIEQYQHMVASGTLRPDKQQLAIVERLAVLVDDLTQYQGSFETYERNRSLYQDKWRRRLAELEAADQKAGQSNEHHNDPKHTATLGWSAWFRQALVGNQSGSQHEVSTVQQAVLAAKKRVDKVRSELGPPPNPPKTPKGLYIHGTVGSGKTLLMDLFNEAVKKHAHIQHQRRMHFNHAMMEVHSRLHLLEKWRQQQQQQQQQPPGSAGAHVTQAAGGGDDALAAGEEEGGTEGNEEQQQPKRSGLMRYWDAEVQRQKQAKQAQLAIRRHLRQAKLVQFKPEALASSSAAVMRQVAASFIRGSAADPNSGWGSHGRVAGLLCFDEMQVADTFAAAALKSIFQALLAEGCVVVTTSNRAPWELNSYGFHEDLFNHFVHQINSHCEVVSLSSDVDYRRLLEHSSRQQQATCSYFCPSGQQADAEMEGQWSRMGPSEEPVTVQVMFGRTLQVARSRGGAAWLHFQDLCARPLGAPDYAAIATSFHTLFLTGVPAMSMQTRDQARRFITLIDELYNARVRLVASAAAPPDLLFTGDHDEPIIDLEGLQFETAAEGSRMRRDLLVAGGVAPIAAKQNVVAGLGGEEERFAFRRAISRLHEMQTTLYIQSRQRA